MTMMQFKGNDPIGASTSKPVLTPTTPGEQTVNMAVKLTGDKPDADRAFFEAHFSEGTTAVLTLVCDLCRGQEGFSPSCTEGCAAKIQAKYHEIEQGIVKAKIYGQAFWKLLDDKMEASNEAVRDEIRKRDKAYKIPGRATVGEKVAKVKSVASANPDKQAATIAAAMGMTLDEAKAFLDKNRKG